MKTRNQVLIFNSAKQFTGPVPVECPHCGLFVSPVIKNVTGFTYIQNSIIYLVTYRGDCCDKDFFCLYTVINGTAELISIYPNTKSSALPDAIQKISPRFVELYDQCYIAEQNGHFDLAGSGYRNAIEVLVKDFAIKELKLPHEEVVKKKLAASIKAYLPTINLKQSADVVRILGNEYTHYEQSYGENTFYILKQYVEIFIKSIETSYLIKHPLIKTQFEEEA